MTEYRKGSHTVFSVHLHLVWITKYRKPILTGDVALCVRDLLRVICERNRVEIIQGHVAKDHVHMLVSIPPSLSISRLMQLMKGHTSYKLLNEFQSLRRQYWGRHMWARGYFCCSSGNVTDEVIKKYIEQQDEADETFRISGDAL
ncbi:MAG: IS200/IS605 family transposase [Desulfovibrionaceae bacterium]|nr:IS200/IS605 family transposase [Desulfovibrionaceae bacterium]